MKKAYVVIYVTVTALAVLSYVSVRPFVVAQEPPDTSIVVSNLTLNYVLFVLLVGAFVPFVTRRLFPKRFKVMLLPTAVIIGVILILTLRTLGFDMRF